MYSDRPIPNPSASSASASILKVLQQPRPNSAHTPAKLPQGGAVEACSEAETQGATAFSPDFPTESRSSSSCSSTSPPGHSATSSSSSPSDYHDSYLLTRVAAIDADPIALAEELGIRLELFLDWMSAPQTVKRLNTIVNARDMIEQQKEKTESSRMLASLARAHDRAVKANDHVEQRRAAIAYLRFANRPQSRRGHFGCARATDIRGSSENVGAASAGLSLSRFPERFRTRARFVRTVPILHEAPAILSPPNGPNPVNTPEQATIALLHRLQDSDNPSDGDGLRTLFHHFTPEWRKRLRIDNADDFACTEFSAYHKLLGHHSAVLHPMICHPAAYEGGPILRATQRASLVDLDGDLQLLTLKFHRVSINAPWLIDDLQLKLDSAGPPPPSPTPSPPPTPNSS